MLGTKTFASKKKRMKMQGERNEKERVAQRAGRVEEREWLRDCVAVYTRDEADGDCRCQCNRLVTFR